MRSKDHTTGGVASAGATFREVGPVHGQAFLFLSSSWRGEGSVRGPFGQTLRRFTVLWDGAWSEPHEAFHIDERVTYADGRSLERRWAISYDGLRRWSGADDSAGRLRISERDGVLVLRFDRSGAVKGFTVASLRLELRPYGSDVMRGRGITRLFGLPVAWTEVAFRHASDTERSE